MVAPESHGPLLEIDVSEDKRHSDWQCQRGELQPGKEGSWEVSSYVYGVFGAQRSRDCTVTVLVSQIKRGHVTALSQ